jgi:Flp pilus assembly protein TadB
VIRTLILAAPALWCGATLVLSDRRWFARPPLADRLRPYVPGGMRHGTTGGILSVDSFRDVVAPLATAVGTSAGRLLGVHDDLATRLERCHSPLDPTALRVRQLTWSAATFTGAALLTLAVQLPLPVALLAVLGGPGLAFLVVERQLTAASARWQERLVLELPVISEQIGMLLSAGYSLGSALDRIARRSTGACAQDLARVGRRVRQGLSDTEALREWADLADVAAVHHLVGILALDRDAGDLGRLISDEARTLRREVQRSLAATIDRRAQQVWIPVTVATLVPGTIFLAVPFLQALRLFASA